MFVYCAEFMRRSARLSRLFPGLGTVGRAHGGEAEGPPAVGGDQELPAVVGGVGLSADRPAETSAGSARAR